MAQEQNTLKKLATKYGLVKDDFWKHKQSGSWIISHDGVIKIAVQEKIAFTLEKWSDDADRKCMKVTATHPSGQLVEIVGECKVGKGITSEYPWAMAQKRAEDRCVIRIVAGGLLYSEVEAEVFSRPQPTQKPLDAYQKRSEEIAKEPS